jgi:hypothetical protein
MAPLTLVPFAHAEDAASDISAARTLGVEGVKLADAGKCDEAVDRLSRAEKLHHAPSVLERLGECQVALGRIVDGTESLQKVVREDLAPNAPLAFVAAKLRAQKALEAAKLKVAKLVIQVSGAPQDAVVVKVDGQVVSSAYVGVARPTDPGDHNVDVSAPGFKVASKHVILSAGGTETVSLTLEVDANAAPPPENKTPGTSTVTSTGTKTGETVPAPATQSHGSSRVKTVGEITSFAVAGVGVAVGAIFGILAMGKKSTLDGECISKGCPAGSQGTIDDANTFGTVSTVGFIVGGVGLVAGIIFLAIPGPKAAPATGITVTPMMGLGSLGASGSF